MSKIIILSAPSGAGKSTIVKELLKHSELKLGFSVSTTSRAPRGAEQNGVEYYFITKEQFENQIAQNYFLEWQEVYEGTYYGTYRSEINRLEKSGLHPLFDIDVYGALNIKKQYGNRALTIFIQPPSVAVLKERLTQRSTDSAEKIAQRLAKANEEIAQAQYFDKIVVNDNLHEAVAQTLYIIQEALK